MIFHALNHSKFNVSLFPSPTNFQSFHVRLLDLDVSVDAKVCEISTGHTNLEILDSYYRNLGLDLLFERRLD